MSQKFWLQWERRKGRRKWRLVSMNPFLDIELNFEIKFKECLHNGTKYRVGETVPVGNPCKVCQCGYGFTHAYSLPYSTPFTTIHCINVECPEHFGVHRFPLSGFEKDFKKLQNCYNIYNQNQCCAVSRKCLGEYSFMFWKSF